VWWLLCHGWERRRRSTSVARRCCGSLKHSTWRPRSRHQGTKNPWQGKGRGGGRWQAWCRKLERLGELGRQVCQTLRVVSARREETCRRHDPRLRGIGWASWKASWGSLAIADCRYSTTPTTRWRRRSWTREQDSTNSHHGHDGLCHLWS
jgi:hypothetical protein